MKISNLGNARLRKPVTSKQYNNDGEKKTPKYYQIFFTSKRKEIA